MALNYIENYGNFFLRSDYRPIVKHGHFSLTNKVDMTLNVDKLAYACHAEMTTDFECVGKNIDVVNTINGTDYSGFNKRFIDENGNYHPRIALEEFSKIVFERQLVNADTYRTVDKYEIADSHEVYLLNMLISWAMADMYKSSGRSDGKFTVKTKPYEDDHAIISLDGTTEEMEIEVELGPPVPTTANTVPWQQRGVENYWDRPYVIYYNAPTIAHETFYVYHALGRNKKTRLNIDLELKGVNPKETLLQALGGRTGIATDVDSVPWDSPDTLWSWIKDYVSLNRLHQQFAAAIEVLFSIMYHPKWSSAEGNMWRHASLKINIGEFLPTRARFLVNLEGDAYYDNSMPMEFISDISFSPNNAIAIHSIANYYMWYGAYLVMWNKSVDFEKQMDAFRSITDEDSVLRHFTMRSALMSIVVGQEIPTCMTPSCNLTMALYNMARCKEISVTKNKDGTYQDVIPIDKIYAPVSGSLILGTVVVDLPICQHLKPTQMMMIKGRPGRTPLKAQEAIKLANLYRLFGHEITFKNMMTNSEFRPWAPVHELIIEPYSIEGDYFLTEHHTPMFTKARDHRNVYICDLGTMMAAENAILTVHRPQIYLTEYGSRTEVKNMHRPNSSEHKRSLVVKVKAGFSYTKKLIPSAPTRPEANFGQEHPASVPDTLSMPETIDPG